MSEDERVHGPEEPFQHQEPAAGGQNIFVGLLNRAFGADNHNTPPSTHQDSNNAPFFKARKPVEARPRSTGLRPTLSESGPVIRCTNAATPRDQLSAIFITP